MPDNWETLRKKQLNNQGIMSSMLNVDGRTESLADQDPEDVEGGESILIKIT